MFSPICIAPTSRVVGQVELVHSTAHVLPVAHVLPATMPATHVLPDSHVLPLTSVSLMNLDLCTALTKTIRSLKTERSSSRHMLLE